MTTALWSTPSHFASTTTVAHYATVLKELHDKLTSCGLVRTSDTGQLDFPTLLANTSSLTVNTNYGYLIYRLDDGIDLPLFLKVLVTTGTNDSATNGSYALNLSFGFQTDGAGNLVGGSEVVRVGIGESYWWARATGSPSQTSCVCVTDGFLGVSWKERYMQPSASYGPSSDISDAPCLAAFMLCRDTDESGAPTNTGATLFAVGPGGKDYATYGAAPVTVHLTAAGVQNKTARCAFAIASDTTTTVSGSVPVYNVYTLTPAPDRLAQVGIAPRTSLGDKDEFQMALKGTQQRNFIALRGVWPGDILTGNQTKTCVVMLWE